VFAHHKNVLDGIEKFIRGASDLPGYIRIDGSTPVDQRQEYVNQFQHDDDCRVALLSITAAGMGITLHAAAHVVFAELHWTPAYLAQAEDRVHRIGQRSHCLIHYVLARNTLGQQQPNTHARVEQTPSGSRWVDSFSSR
jgi:SWI/SNF-related matrix-associated actin-dependent regulator 1 of chromatin subfamily A